MEDVAAFYKMNMPATSTDRFRLEAPGRSIEGADNGRNVYINGVKYALCFRSYLKAVRRSFQRWTSSRLSNRFFVRRKSRMPAQSAL